MRFKPFFLFFRQDDGLKKPKVEAQSTDISEKSSPSESLIDQNDINDSSNEPLVVDCDTISNTNSQTFMFDELHSRRRMKPTRGSKRGRPRGSKRGNRGGISRVDTNISKTLSTSLDSGSLSDKNAFEPVISNVSQVRRGPGRPRLKPNGPANQGNRSVQKYRKPIGPLVVPLGSSPATTPSIRSPAMSPVPSPSPSLHERGLGFRQNTANDTI